MVCDRTFYEALFKSGEQWEVFRPEEGLSSSEGMASRSNCHLTRRASSAFSSGEKINIVIEDRIRFAKNVKHRGQNFLNKELRTVISINKDKITFDKGEILHNGAALHIDQGITVTSHASQTKTVDQVIVSVPVRARLGGNRCSGQTVSQRVNHIARGNLRPSTGGSRRGDILERVVFHTLSFREIT
jgi:hypothetical protein